MKPLPSQGRAELLPALSRPEESVLGFLGSFDAWAGETGAAGFSARLRMARVLRSGHEFDSRLAVETRRTAGKTELRLDVERPGSSSATYLGEVRQGRLEGLRQARPGVPGVFSELPLDANLPIGLGDLQIGDVLALVSGLRDGTWSPLGELDTFNAVRLLVLDLDFGAAGRRAGPESFHGYGASALVYLDAERLVPRTIRVFDAGGRLVRTYTAFDFETSGPRPVLRSFRASSVLSESDTTFYIESPAILPPGP